jgi:tripartite-type tricarboxylate transporter receptor subunit TctC
MNDALGGHVDTIIGSAALATPQIKNGKLIGIMNTGAKRLTALSDVGTGIEAGFPGFEAYAWWGVFAPGGTPRSQVERFAGAMTEILREEKNAKTLQESWQIDLRLGGPDVLKKFFAEQMTLWGGVVKEQGIKGDG